MTLSDNARRARRLLAGGVVGAAVVGVVGTIIAFVVGGPAAGLTALAAALIALVFFSAGQAVQIACADLPPSWVLVASLVSYLVRIGVLALALGVGMARAAEWGVVPVALAGQMVASVIGWLAGEIWSYARLRIPVYDVPSGGIEPPQDSH